MTAAQIEARDTGRPDPYRQALDYEQANDAYWQAQYRGHWIDPTTGLKTDLHERDRPPEPPDHQPGPRHDTSEHVIRFGDCKNCGQELSYYGRADQLPDLRLCTRCTHD